MGRPGKQIVASAEERLQIERLLPGCAESPALQGGDVERKPTCLFPGLRLFSPLGGRT